jgi:hypothetical protein
LKNELQPKSFWPLSAILRALTGTIVVGIGAYFIFLRSPLLPEDIAYMRLSTADLSGVGPRLERWLTLVFRVLGGYAVATGLLMIALAATAFRARRRVAVASVFISGAASIGLMACVNFSLSSDFKWPLLGVAAIWALSLIVFGVEEWIARSASPGRRRL